MRNLQNSQLNDTKWSLISAVTLCEIIESICPKYGYHVALTGGCLYKHGRRKDLDLLFYRIRQVETPDTDGMLSAFEKRLGIVRQSGFGWCIKATQNGKNIDMFFPEEVDGEYETQEPPRTIQNLFLNLDEND